MSLTRRVDLVWDKGTVLIEMNGMLRPFEIIESYPAERKTKGIWLVTGKEDLIDSGTPCVPITNEWIDKTISLIEEKIISKKTAIETLKSIRIEETTEPEEEIVPDKILDRKEICQ